MVKWNESLKNASISGEIGLVIVQTFSASGKTEVTVTREGDFIPNSHEEMEEINIFQGMIIFHLASCIGNLIASV